MRKTADMFRWGRWKMKSRIPLLIIILITLLTSVSCNTANNVSDEETGNKDAAVLDIMPFSERLYIYNNGLNIEYKEETANENNIDKEKYYPQINGLINKEVEKKINDSIINSIDVLAVDTEIPDGFGYSGTNTTIESISARAHAVYNCNNVIFIRYSKYVVYNSGPDSASYDEITSEGFDLNTGNKLKLKDLFKSGSDYKKIINDYIFMEIIRCNYDDPDSMYMNKPFQGIKEDQGFSFNEDYITIIMDEKNDEFNHLGYPVTMEIPLREIGDELAVFDRYFNEEINIFESERTKKLMPNYIYYKVNGGVSEHEENYSIQIETGEFINLDNIETKNMLESMFSHNMDVDGFKKRASAFNNSNPGKRYGGLYYNAEIAMQSGGYLSMAVNSTVDENGIVNNKQKFINFDFKNNKIMTLKDLFTEGYDYKNEIIKILKEDDNYSMPDDLKNEENVMLSEEEFNFGQDYVYVNLYRPGQESPDNFVWVEYKDIGYENIAVFQ